MTTRPGLVKKEFDKRQKRITFAVKPATATHKSHPPMDIKSPRPPATNRLLVVIIVILAAAVLYFKGAGQPPGT